MYWFWNGIWCVNKSYNHIHCLSCIVSCNKTLVYIYNVCVWFYQSTFISAVYLSAIFTFVFECSVFVFIFGSHIKHGAADICMSFSSRNFVFCHAYVVWLLSTVVMSGLCACVRVNALHMLLNEISSSSVVQPWLLPAISCSVSGHVF